MKREVTRGGEWVRWLNAAVSEVRWLNAAVSGGRSKGPHCPIAKETRFRADRPRLPWRGRFAFRAGRVFLGWLVCAGGCWWLWLLWREENGWRCGKVKCGSEWGAVVKRGGEWRAVERPALPDRKGNRLPCGSAAPSVARTLCFSDRAGLSGLAEVRWRLLVAGCCGGRGTGGAAER